MSAIPGGEVIVLYGSTEAEPISAIWADEKLQLEGEKSEGLCVGKPVFDNSTKVIQLLKGMIWDYMIYGWKNVQGRIICKLYTYNLCHV